MTSLTLNNRSQIAARAVERCHYSRNNYQFKPDNAHK